MIQYILAVLILCILVFFAYTKLKYPFWNNQAVFHTYDFHRYFYTNPFIVYQQPMKTKFLDLSQIRTYHYLDITEYQQKEFTNLLQCYYIPTERITHNITNEDLITYFSGHIEPCYLSLYQPKSFQVVDSSYNQPNIQVTQTEHSLGCITSRPINMLYKSTLHEFHYEKLPIYFMDYLCLHRQEKQKELNRKLLQTHEYNQRLFNPNIKVSLIKKEVDLFDGVVPLVTYSSHTYRLNKTKLMELPDHYFIEEIKETNLHLLSDFFIHSSENTSKTMYFDVILFNDMNNVLALIKQKLLYVYCLKRKNNIHAFYFFKNMRTYYEDAEGNTLQVLSSIMNCSSYELFYYGFVNSLTTILKMNKDIKMMLFDDIAHNSVLLRYWSQQNRPIFSNQNAYYLMNFIYPCSPMLKERCFILF